MGKILMLMSYMKNNTDENWKEKIEYVKLENTGPVFKQYLY